MGTFKNLPLYELCISADENDGVEVDYVALVDQPAIQATFQAFNKHFAFSVVDEERRIISGPLMFPDTPIYRQNKEQGEFYIQFSKDTVEQIALKFFKKKYQQNVNLMHQTGAEVTGVTMFESFLSDSRRGLLPMKGYEDAPDGTWFGSFKVENEEVWTKIKAGEFQGFSVQGLFEARVTAKTKKEQFIAEVAALLEEWAG